MKRKNTLMSSLRLIICGMEHTGTTLISDLFRQVPHLDSGFECGVLLGESPTQFSTIAPFPQNMLDGWGLTQNELETCCATKSFEEFYERLMSTARFLPEDTTNIFDKTPRYLSDLTNVIRRTTAPIVVSHKDPRAMVCSDFKRAQTDDFIGWYETYLPAKREYFEDCYREYSIHKNSTRVLTVGLEELAMNSRAKMEQMFAHIGEDFQLNYTIIKELRYDHTKSRTVSADIVFEYLSFLTPKHCALIEQDFSFGEDWFYE